ncbi:MAG: DUF1028 domain-containing protein [Flavobacteriales bacterium]|nr:DUF1028 domain-containing protein [Flavobacteriales bacterium]
MKTLIFSLQTAVVLLLLFGFSNVMYAQHTFSIVAVDSITGEIGSAGATCLDIDDLAGEEGALPINDIILGIGTINTQAYWHPVNQAAARVRMLEGDSPQQILDWLAINDPAPGNHADRQYGIIDLIDGAGGSPRAVGFTGADCWSVANHIVGPDYVIQGNILISQDILNDMETGFLNASGNLADKLMSSIQGANVVGAQYTCTDNQTSSKSAYLRVAQVEDLYSNYGHLTIDLNVSKTNFAEDPIDVLQTTYDYYLNNPGTDCQSSVTEFPYTESFENGLGLWVQNDMDLSHIGSPDFDWVTNSLETPTTNTGPGSAIDGSFYLYTEATGANVGFPAKRAVLNSPCLDLSNIGASPTLTFDYHMYGNTAGFLALRINDGSGWNTIWLINGNQGDQWNTASIDLQNYSGQTIQVRMDATTGLGEQSDIAIDNVSVQSGATGMMESYLGTIQILQHPEDNEIDIALPEPMESKALIYDLHGRLISELNFNTQYYQLDISLLNSGMYLVQITSEKGFATRRIIR